MAYERKYAELLRPDEEDDLTGPAATGGLGSGAAASPAPPASSGASAESAGGKFVNFDRMLAANYGDARSLGGSIADEVGQQAGEAEDTVSRSATDYVGKLDDLDAGTPHPGAPLPKPAFADLSPWPDRPEPAPAPQAAPPAPRPPPGVAAATAPEGTTTAPAPPPAQKPSGPQPRIGGLTFADLGLGNWNTRPEFQAAGDGLRKAADSVRNLGGNDSRGVMIQDRVMKDNAGANYTQGQNRFDNALVGAAAGDKFGEVQSKFGNLDKWFGDLQGAIGQHTADVSGSIDRAAEDFHRTADAQNARDNAANAERQAVAKAEAETRARDEAAAWSEVTDVGPSGIGEQAEGWITGDTSSVALDHRPSYEEFMALGPAGMEYKWGAYYSDIDANIYAQMSDAEVRELLTIAKQIGLNRANIFPSGTDTDLGNALIEFKTRMKQKYGR